MCSCKRDVSLSYMGNQLVSEERVESCEACIWERAFMEAAEREAENRCECGNWKREDAQLCDACLTDCAMSLEVA